MTFNPMYYYDALGTFNLILTEEQMQEVYDRFMQRKFTPEDDYEKEMDSFFQ